MTSRRTFLGLLAAAPVAIPVAIQSAVAKRYASGGLVRGLSWSRPYGIVGERGPEGIMSLKQYAAFNQVLDAPSAPNAALFKLMRSTTPWDIPNRLYGAEINDEGDAI